MPYHLTTHESLQVMVWRTNFDRHLDDFVLSHIERGETQLKHDTDIFTQPVPPSTQKENHPQANSPDSSGAPVAVSGGPKRILAVPRDGQHSTVRVNRSCLCMPARL